MISPWGHSHKIWITKRSKSTIRIHLLSLKQSVILTTNNGSMLYVYKNTLRERKSTHTITRQTNRNPLLYGAYLVTLFSVKTHYQKSSHSHIPVMLLISVTN